MVMHMTTINRMAEIGTSPAQDASTRGVRTAPALDITEVGWQVLGWVGLAMLVAALGTIASVWVPVRFGNLDWEFGTVADSFVAMPLLIIGIGACLASAVARQRRKATLAIGVGLLLLLLWLLASGVVFSTTAVVAWQRAEEASGLVAVGVKRVIARTVWFGLIGSVGCAVAALYSFRTFVVGTRRNRA